MDPPLADVVSFAEKARMRRQRGLPDAANEVEPWLAGAGDDISTAPADLARQAMFRRLDQLTGRAAASGGMRSVDDELAVLVYDSSTEPEPLAGVRGGAQPGGPRQLTFQAADLLIEVELDVSGREMTCQVVPPQPASLEVRHVGGTLELGVDEFGTFYVPELPGSPISLWCMPLTAEGEPTVTSWITV
jgi:hypothetical protein